MDVLVKYLYLASPLKNVKVSAANTFYALKEKKWYSDMRSSDDYQMMNKRFKINEEWYRVMVRFRKVEDYYEIDLPAPFLITHATTEDEKIFIDQKVYHGRKLKNALGYIKEGVPKELLDVVLNEIEETCVFL